MPLLSRLIHNHKSGMCHGKTHKDMVEKLASVSYVMFVLMHMITHIIYIIYLQSIYLSIYIHIHQAGIVKAPINKQALLSVDRRNYVLNKDYAYEDSPQPIGYGATIR